MIPPLCKYPSEVHTSQHLQRVTPTSEEEEEDDETLNKCRNGWQVIRRTKRKKIHRTQQNTPRKKIETRN